MSKHTDYVLVLALPKFDELSAATFVTILRDEGLRIRLVGVTRQPTAGSHGLAFVPDVSVNQADNLIEFTTCLIIPHRHRYISWLIHEPRLDPLLNRVRIGQAHLVIHQEILADLTALIATDVIATSHTYTDDMDLATFTQELALRLLS